MADRIVKVSLVATVNNYVANMEAARKATVKVGDSLEAQKKASIEAAKAQGEAAKKIGAGLLAIGAVAAVGVGLAIKKFGEFDQAMSNVKAATQETAGNMGLLRDAALEAGAKTVFSATEAANAIEELGKAGLSTADILNGGLDGALSLAAAGGLGVAEAAGIAATALKTFELNGSDMGHVADLLAAGAGKAMGDVTDLAGALSQAGLVAAGTGISIEETTATLSAFASKGLLGSDAGTSFKSMLQRLTPQSKEAADKMEELKIQAYDAQGNFVGMEKYAGILQTRLKGLSVESRNSALATVFGSDAVRAANVLYTEGADGIAEWTGKVDDTGYAAKVAADRLDNLRGDVEQLGGSLDTALIKTGSGANDMLRNITQSVTGLVNIFGDADPVVQQVTLSLGLTVAGIGLAGGAALIAVPKIAQLKATFATLNVSMGKTALVGGAVGLAVTALTVVLGAVSGAAADAKGTADALRDSLDQQTGALTSNTRAAAAKGLQDSGAAETAAAMGVSLETLTDAVFGNKDAIAELAAAKDKFKANPFDPKADVYALDRMSGSVAGLQKQIKKAPGEWRELKRATGEASDANGDLAGSYDKVTEAVDGTVTSVKDLAKELDAANGAHLSARDAARNLEAAYDDFDATIKKNGKTLDITTEKGRENQAALDGIAEAAGVVAQKIVDSGGSYDEYRKSLEGSRAEIDDRIAKLGITGDKAKELADNILHIPTKAEWTMYADTEAAAARLQRIQDLINGIGATSQLHISTGVGGQGGMTRAEGGSVYGPGTATSDSIPVWLSNGEEVTRTAMADKYRPLLKAINADQVDDYWRTARGHAAGGTVGYAAPVQYVPSGGGWGGGGHSTTNSRGDTNWQITSTGVDPAELAAKIAGQVAWRERSGF